MAIKNTGTKGSTSGASGAKGRLRKDGGKDFDIAVTAEIPEIPQQEVYSLQLPMSPGARRHQKKKPAPFALRALAWVCVFLLLIALGGIWAEKTHPQWFSSLRAVVSTGNPGSTSSNHGHRVKKVLSKPYGSVVTGATQEKIFVPAAGYDINITVAKPCWVKVYSPAYSSSILFEQVLQPGVGVKTLQITGSAEVTFGAVPTSFSITTGSKSILQINNPKILPYKYILSPE